MENYQKQFPGLQVEYSSSLEDLASGCDALVLLTEWDQFMDAPWYKLLWGMRSGIFIDGRNFLDPQVMSRMGYQYRGIGRRMTPEKGGTSSPEDKS